MLKISATSKTWTQTLDLDPEKAWTLKNLGRKQPKT